MAQFLENFWKSQYLVNRIKKIMIYTISVIIIFYYFLILLALPESVFPWLNFLRTMDARFAIPILLFVSIIICSIAYLISNMKFEKFDKFLCSIYLKMVKFDSFFLLPIFLFSTGFLFMSFIFYYSFLFKLGMFLFWIGIFLFYIVFLLKIHVESTIFYMLKVTNIIFDDLPENKMDNNTSKKLNKYIKKIINNIDNKLGNDLNINELMTDKDETSRVKNIIINYLPLYLKYGTKKQIDSLKNHIYSMSLLVEKNDDFSLIIMKNLMDIYNDIDCFFNSKSFLIIEKGRHDKLSIVKDNSTIIFGSLQLIIFILYLYLYGPSPIP